MIKHCYLIGLFALVFPVFVHADTTRFSGFIEQELRIYPSKGLHHKQEQALISAAFQPSVSWKDDSQQHQLKLTAFARVAAPNGNRNHIDFREAYYVFSQSQWLIKAGISQVFWGVTESIHLVDTINQADLMENPTGKEKLGQPMLNISTEQAFGNIDFYVLPFFRARRFATGAERFQLSLPSLLADYGEYDSKKAFYQAGNDDKHVDTALRWNHYFGDFDLAISAFHGTSRESIPVLQQIDIATPSLRFASWYEQTTHLGLEMQYLFHEWAFKFEGNTYWQPSGDYSAFATGFEYTFSDVGDYGFDVGLLGEYLWNNRHDFSITKISLKVLNIDSSSIPALTNALEQNKIPGDYLTPFNNDLFLGTRFSLNDVASTQFLAGVIIDLDNQTTVASFEGSTRIKDQWKLAINLYLLKPKEKTSTFYPFRKDNQIEFKASWYF